ncbi:MAG: trehalose-phosphatase [Candidatus Peribacteraceae bacterium]|nr:trehalose-phosphatase [Candidatus Peribacteraceae bacterium]MDD5742277.1 trehalose-phosphatase [Candidatus Peribacteraceae bacterium]
MRRVPDILSPRGRDALRALRQQRVLIAFDFDGTIAPLARHPASVRVSSGVRRQLQTLAAAVPVAIVSGRSLADLRRYFPRFPGLLVGNHGAEGLSGHRPLAAARRACRLWRRHLLRLLHVRRASAGVWLEDKSFSLTVHSRSPAVLRTLRRQLAHAAPPDLPPMHFLSGKASINILFPAVPDKGEAVLLLLRRTRAEGGLFVGDDETDEAVFSLKKKTLITVRVGHARQTQAAFFLHSQKEIGCLLATLIDLRRLPSKRS